jgi:phenylpyruvate tautomerase PptA (4-oxalocrotonate tautomerase family)
MYLGINRSRDALVIQITLNKGRTVDLKKALYKAVADALEHRIGLCREDVFINLVEVKKENWSFGNGEAQYAQATPGRRETGTGELAFPAIFPTVGGSGYSGWVGAERRGGGAIPLLYSSNARSAFGRRVRLGWNRPPISTLWPV